MKSKYFLTIAVLASFAVSCSEKKQDSASPESNSEANAEVTIAAPTAAVNEQASIPEKAYDEKCLGFTDASKYSIEVPLENIIDGNPGTYKLVETQMHIDVSFLKVPSDGKDSKRSQMLYVVGIKTEKESNANIPEVNPTVDCKVMNNLYDGLHKSMLAAPYTISRENGEFEGTVRSENEIVSENPNNLTDSVRGSFNKFAQPNFKMLKDKIKGIGEFLIYRLSADKFELRIVVTKQPTDEESRYKDRKVTMTHRLVYELVQP